MDYMFYNCESLKVIELSELKTSSVKTMNSMFAGCSSLTYLYISIFDMTNLEKAEDMFDKFCQTSGELYQLEILVNGDDGFYVSDTDGYYTTLDNFIRSITEGEE